MEKEINAGKKIEELAKEVRTWEILEIFRERKTLEEAEDKVKALLNK